MPSRKSTRRKKGPVIVVGGLAGSGKSTVSKALAKRFRMRHVSVGDMVRAVVKERKTDLISFGRYLEAHPKLDRVFDRRMVQEAKEGGCVIDGRAIASLTKKAGIPALRVFLTVDPKVAAKRVSRRDGVSVAQALEKSRLRERGIKRRLTALYGLDTFRLSHYDAVIETDDYSPREIVDLIAQLVTYGRT